jgi:hypothetical protein
MSDLTTELRRMAEDAARQARPAAVADVIRRGQRRRKRTIAQQSLGGLSAVGIGAAVIFTVGGAPAVPAASPTLAAGSSITLKQTTSSSAGTMTIQVKYQPQAHGRIKLLSVGFSGHAKEAARHPAFIVKLTPGASQASTRPSGSAGSAGLLPPHVFFFPIMLRPGEQHAFSGSLPASDIASTKSNEGLVDGELMQTVFGSVTTIGGSKARVHTELQEFLILAR